MYVHVGEDVMVRTSEMIAVLDKNSAKESKIIEEFLKHETKKIFDLAKGAYKSIVITTDQVYLSPLASTTLKKRMLRRQSPHIFL